MRPAGAVPHQNGTSFSVWAPHAAAVYVTGSFNSWDMTKHPMQSAADGWWSLDIADARPGDEYLYRIINNDREYTRIDPYARQVTDSLGHAIIRDPCRPQAGFNPPPLEKMVIYELHIGTFGKQGTDPGPGDLRGAIERLAYLKDLGINAVEIMPLAEFAGGFSWGYNPSQIFAIESEYGAPHTFSKFVTEAHRLGIAVIVDVVYNHLGPTDLNLWQFDGWSENDKGGIYFYNDWRSSTPWGETRPDYGRQEVREYIRDNALTWFKEYGVDGLRWDMTAYIRNVEGHNNPASDLPEGWSLMQWINGEIRQQWPGAITIAEDLQNNAYLTKPVQDGGAGFSAQWAAPFVHAVRNALLEADDAQRDMQAVRNAILHRYYLNAFERVIYTESHDEVSNGKARVPEEVDPGRASSWAAKKKSTLGAALVLTAPGIPMLFQGQEFLEDDWFHDQDPIDWTKKTRFGGILKLYQDLIRLRLNRDGRTAGLSGQNVDVYHLDNDSKVIAYHRWQTGGPGDSVVVLANFSTRTLNDYLLAMPAAAEWRVVLNSDSRHYDPEFGDLGNITVQTGANNSVRLNIAPYSVLILSQTNAQ